MGNILWTEERAAMAMANCKSGMSMSDNAKLLGGVSRNAVIGKLHRMGYWPGKSAAKAKEDRPSMPRRPKVKMIGVNRATAAKRKLIAKVRAGDEEIALAGDGVRELPADQSAFAVSFMAVSDTQCRWPLGEPSQAGFMFCGDKIMGGKSVSECAYCARHCRLAYNGAPQRKPDTYRERSERAVNF